MNLASSVTLPAGGGASVWSTNQRPTEFKSVQRERERERERERVGEGGGERGGERERKLITLLLSHHAVC